MKNCDELLALNASKVYAP